MARTAATILIAAAVSGSPATTATASDQCLGPGEAVAPVPWAQALLKPDRVWPLSTGAGQRVAVVSTGISDTPFLAGAVPERVDLAPAAGPAEPSGRIDCAGIGTGVAGIIAAAPTDGIGFHGMAPAARILDAKVVGDQLPTGQQPAGTVAPELLANGIQWAVDQNATVIVTPTGTYQDDPALRQTVAAALAAGTVIVAAVGEPDANEETPGQLPYPAAYGGVIGVGAIGPDGTVQDSRAGHVDLVAPGWDLVTAYPADGLGPAGGTAYAAGYVAGSVALVRAYRPDLSPAEVAQRLFATAAPAPEGAGSPRYGYGIVNPYQAVVEQVAAGEPAAPAPFRPAVLTETEREKLAAEARSDAIAGRLAVLGLAAALVTAVGIGLGTRARRRQWRVGVATLPAERPEEETLGPPMDLFDEHPRSHKGQK